MPKGQLKIKNAEMENFVSASSLVEGIKIDESASKKVGNINLIQVSARSLQDVKDVVDYMHDMEVENVVAKTAK